ncbi:hypothetical protein K431DRAFT_9011 [Polychaeton citri CBS 116435]|uniref:Uncharacterized protein n=1 Tax=Polychaeton citri CBS 116435 TaxID=1314669 RepID=A0A9P4QB06_9PEZI|nr:hypothetical protein K431DRAFT_9011 [Polychaeton citri CBS 116435]
MARGSRFGEIATNAQDSNPSQHHHRHRSLLYYDTRILMGGVSEQQRAIDCLPVPTLDPAPCAHGYGRDHVSPSDMGLDGTQSHANPRYSSRAVARPCGLPHDLSGMRLGDGSRCRAPPRILHTGLISLMSRAGPGFRVYASSHRRAGLRLAVGLRALHGRCSGVC